MKTDQTPRLNKQFTLQDLSIPEGLVAEELLQHFYQKTYRINQSTKEELEKFLKTADNYFAPQVESQKKSASKHESRYSDKRTNKPLDNLLKDIIINIREQGYQKWLLTTVENLQDYIKLKPTISAISTAIESQVFSRLNGIKKPPEMFSFKDNKKNNWSSLKQ
jgi:hypothetical protein